MKGVEGKGRGKDRHERRDQEGHEELQCIPEIAGLSCEDLCIHPNLDLPKGFKIPKFDTFGGVGNPMDHLRSYCD